MVIPVFLILVFTLMPDFDIQSGVPEPGITLYGEVRNLKDYLVTSGELEITYTPTAGGDPVTVSTYLEPISCPGNKNYSYAIQIPVESKLDVPPHDVISPGCLGCPTSDRQYNQAAAVDGVSATLTSPTVTLTPQEHRACCMRLDIRVDIKLSANIVADYLLGKIILTPDELSAADKNKNGTIDVGDVVTFLVE